MSEDENQYSALRGQALTVDRAAVGLPEPPNSGVPWGVVMDMAYNNAVVTVCGFADGSASIYFSTGGGFIGGGRHESVRRAAQVLVYRAGEAVSQMVAAAECPLPEVDHVAFYVRTDAGILMASAYGPDLAEREHPLTPLFAAAQDVITQYRLIDQANQPS